VRGRAADASLPDAGRSALEELARLLGRLHRHRAPVQVRPELEPLLALFGGDLDRARAAHPALDLLLGGLAGTVVRATAVDARGPTNVVPDRAEVTLQCLVLPGTTGHDLRAELATALGPGDYELEVGEPLGGPLSSTDTPLRAAIEDFLAEHDPDARLVPALGYGFSDCHFLREAYGAVTYGFVPFRHADPVVNLTTKHGVDERVLVDDLEFQVLAARSLARAVGRGEPPQADRARSVLNVTE
jgi:acetylornithine deacetylase/succinyl-diaminopimelate desuccinylase-like protein